MDMEALHRRLEPIPGKAGRQRCEDQSPDALALPAGSPQQLCPISTSAQVRTLLLALLQRLSAWCGASSGMRTSECTAAPGGGGSRVLSPGCSDLLAPWSRRPGPWTWASSQP